MRLIDVFTIKDKLHVWLYDGKNHFYESEFKPEIFVLASFREQQYIKHRLEQRGIHSNFELRRTLRGHKRVLRVVTAVGSLAGLRNYILRLCNYSCEVFNSDIPLPEYFLFEKGLFPTANVLIKKHGKMLLSISAKEHTMESYEIPKLKVSSLSVRTQEQLRLNPNAQLISISFNGRNYQSNGFVKAFQEEDPDILVTDDGNLELPYLLKLIRKNLPGFSFSRFGRDEFKTGGHSYFSYGRVMFKQNSVYLKGRLHFKHTGTLYGGWSMVYPFELGRICRTTLQRANNRSIGSCISNLQLYYAMQHGFLVPRTSTCVEVWKSGAELFEADRGALIFEPVVGFHKDIAEIDFVSLFPSIMVKHNISTETLFCKCCKHNKVPGLNMNLCTRERGVMVDVLEPIVKQREYYKTVPEYKERAEALKGLLVTCFGYMGFRKSKFARIEAHQAIQAYAREILLKAAKLAEEQGFEVVHGIVDSLWVKKPELTKRSVMKLISIINHESGLKIKLEGIYKWIVFLPSTGNKEVPVPTRYYGVFDDGELKCRGMEIRRHDTPDFISLLQGRIIKKLAAARSYEQFLEQMKSAKLDVDEAVSRLLSGHVSPAELVFTKRFSKTEYRGNSAQSIVAKKLKQTGYSINPGEYARYIISNKDSGFAENRYALAGHRYDRKAYAKLARDAYRNLFLPFLKPQPTLFEVLRCVNARTETQGLPIQVKARALREAR